MRRDARWNSSSPRLVMLPALTGSRYVRYEWVQWPLQLAINAGLSLMPLELGQLIGCNGGSFKSPAFPCVAGSGGQRQPEPVADL